VLGSYRPLLKSESGISPVSLIHTVDALLDLLLNRWVEDVSLPPDFNDPSNLVLNISWRAFVRGLGGLGQNGLEGS
jgi:hypothetical protein